MRHRERIAARELRAIVADYRDALPSWFTQQESILSRENSEVRQVIVFDALANGTYRPWSGLEAIDAPGAQIDLQYLGIRHRFIYAREHQRKLADVVRAMREEFRPNPFEELVSTEAFELAETNTRIQKIQNIGTFYALAVLGSELGEVGRARSWATQALALFESRPVPEKWEREQAARARVLLTALDAGADIGALRKTAKESARSAL